ncbi:hypothetical protein ANO14919_143430 [Xylariales sp. No.14919]|nr:hypothetical protein ANO14919_143430 [Xylariales sp. No.14919]
MVTSMDLLSCDMTIYHHQTIGLSGTSTIAAVPFSLSHRPDCVHTLPTTVKRNIPMRVMILVHPLMETMPAYKQQHCFVSPKIFEQPTTIDCRISTRRGP